MKKVLIILIGCLSILEVNAQMLKPTSGFILSERYDSTVTFKQADYIVQGDVIFSKTSSITIEPGVRLFFMPGATIKVNGALNMKGEANKIIQLSSGGGKESGTGLVIGENVPDSSVKINYTSFKFLLKPLVFEKNWFRKDVEVSNSEFFNTYEFNDAVSINEVEFYLNKQTIDFIFRDNVFADNYSNISVYNATSYRVKYKFFKNVFANNLYFDNRAKEESNPVYVNLDDIQGKYTMQIFDNAFSDNHVLSQDSLRLLKDGTIGFLRPKSDFITEKNYTKTTNERAFTQTQPNGDLHAFPLELRSNGELITANAPIDSFINRSINVKINTPIANDQNEFKVFFNFIDTTTGDIIKSQIQKGFEFTNVGAAGFIVKIDSAVVTEPIGYVSVENLKNRDGITVPSINFGLLDFFRKSGTINYKMQFVTLTPIDITKYVQKQYDSSKSQIFEVDSTNYGKWEVGLFAGVSGYAGDLNQNWFYQEKFNIAYGVKLRYHYNRNISARLAFDYSKVGAVDYGLYGPRALSFTSTILTGYVIGEYNFSDRYKSNYDEEVTSLGRKIYPHFGVGVGFLKFNPKATYSDGTVYNLRQFGTEGQTAGGKKYSTLAITLPIQAGLNYRINDHLKVAFEFTAFKLFTDYLDDASKAKYVDDGIIRAANPSNPDVASYFLNPGRDLGARGNPNDKDFIYNIGLSVWYRFHKKADSNYRD